MNKYPLAVVVGVCVGGLVLIASAVTAAIALLRRRCDSRRQRSKVAQEEESVDTHAAAQHAVLSETQPLLNDSAIRTRYAASPTEYAQSFIGSFPNSTLGVPQSPLQTLARSPCNAVQHIVAVAVTDSSDSDDSGVDSSDEESVSGPAAAFCVRPELGRSPYHDPIGTAPIANVTYVPSGSHYAAADCVSGPTECNGQPADLVSQVMPLIVSTDSRTCAVAEKNAASKLEVDEFTTVPDDCSQTGISTKPEYIPDLVPQLQPEELESSTPTTATTCTVVPDISSVFAPQQQQPEPVDAPHQCSSQATTPNDINSRSRSSSAGGQNAEADLLVESTAQPLNNDAKPFKRRCRFWPSCSNGKCKYTHPQQQCHMYPNCAFGGSCIYVHPSDVQKINSVIAGKGARRAKRKNDIIKFNHLESYTR
ncbi:hypothetical protein COEREDRAFT_94554 [Coemansia reversa NRRL 1564]|uniref:C3H1-type domain-containing protein n=1 Tax=Coemansia reversa (strain ATCC 12441 / NRRL 1564) TaxID=763665 RepID=A0A2G5B345_COERN|nr:hypothetical protein COEREDRAFT_94554 [Coemansia reversa NRRL 1564]|eukprot:PIA13442.1 hypothetical protein COEREDRAFT_94554 [Coemansia reversa NRRL 1564]